MTTLRLLVIDDEVDICETIAEIAADRGVEVKTLSNPDSVPGLLASFTPDAIMLDLMMPGTDGVEMLRYLAEQVKSAKVILMSGSDPRVLNSARRLGSAHGLDVVTVFEKPIDITLLRATLDQLIGSDTKAPPGADLSQAIATGQIILYYQPLIEIATRRVRGVEALVRWNHPTRGVLPPSDFLDQISEEGLMGQMTERVMVMGITQAAKWHAQGEAINVSINMPASALLDLSLPERVGLLCEQHNLPAERIILEVTETEAMRDTTRTLDVLVRMRLRGIGVAIDDFGIGYSSLKELQRMPFSEMKIDKSFVLDMASNKGCSVIVNTIIALGHNLGLEIVAEGVEDARVWNLLAERQCDLAQGYYMGRPMPPEDFPAWLEKWRNGNS